MLANSKAYGPPRIATSREGAARCCPDDRSYTCSNRPRQGCWCGADPGRWAPLPRPVPSSRDRSGAGFGPGGDGRPQRHTGLLLRRRTVRRPGRRRRTRRPSARRRCAPGRHRWRVDPSGRRADRRRDRGRTGVAGHPRADRRRRGGQRRHQPRAGGGGRSGRRRGGGQRRLRRPGRPGHGPRGPRRALPVGADALAWALPCDARAGHLHRRGGRRPGRAGPTDRRGAGRRGGRRPPHRRPRARLRQDGRAQLGAQRPPAGAAGSRLPAALRGQPQVVPRRRCSPRRTARRDRPPSGRRPPWPPACWRSPRAPGAYACTTCRPPPTRSPSGPRPAAPAWPRRRATRQRARHDHEHEVRR